MREAAGIKHGHSVGAIKVQYFPRIQGCMWSGMQPSRLASPCIFNTSTAKHSLDSYIVQDFDVLHKIDGNLIMWLMTAFK